MSEEDLIQINKEILLKGLFSLKFSDEDITNELSVLETSKKEITNKLAGMTQAYNKKIEDYKNRLLETEINTS